MTFQVTGQVQNSSIRQTSNGGTATNLQVNGEWYGFGFNGVGDVVEGDTITFNARQNGNYKNGDAKSIKVVSRGGDQAQQNQQRQVSGRQPYSGGGRSRSAQASGGGSRDDYWEKKAERDVVVQKAIQFQASRNAAIEVVKASLAANAVSLPSRKGEQFDAILELVDQVTQRYDENTTKVMQGKQLFETSPDVDFDSGANGDEPFDDDIPF